MSLKAQECIDDILAKFLRIFIIFYLVNVECKVSPLTPGNEHLSKQ